MDVAFMFLAGLFLANGIPHFVHGISGEHFHAPRLHRLIPAFPSTVFNTIWGIGNFLLAAVLAGVARPPALAPDAQWVAAAAGFSLAAVGLSIYFPRRASRESLKDSRA